MNTLLLGLLAGVMAVSAADLTGKWKGSFEVSTPSGENRDIGIFFDFKHSGSDLEGVAGEHEERNWKILGGKVDGDKITFEVKQSPDAPSIKFTLVYSDGRIQGEAHAEREGNRMSGKVNVGRKTD